MSELTPKQKAAGWKMVHVDSVRPQDSQHCDVDDPSKRAFVRQQAETAMIMGAIYCECIKRVPLYHAYKCLYCGEWFCAECAEQHFGVTREEYWKRKNRTAPQS